MSKLTKNPYLDELKQLVLTYTGDTKVKIYLFGSRATGKAHQHSDIDLAILPLEPLPSSFITNLKEKIETSTIPYSVDLINLLEVDPTFRSKILKEALPWKD